MFLCELDETRITTIVTKYFNKKKKIFGMFLGHLDELTGEKAVHSVIEMQLLYNSMKIYYSFS